MTVRALLCAMMLASSQALALEIKPFDSATPAAIARAQVGKPYILVFWSLYCDPCREEMHQWGELQRRHPEVPILLVSTDGPEAHALTEKYLATQRLGRVQVWMFSDEFTERVRYAVDPAWRGELPRTYLFDRAHRAVARSGKVPAGEISDWIARVALGSHEVAR
jgi:thiol-disulfide isomerase/thioredoxin